MAKKKKNTGRINYSKRKKVLATLNKVNLK